MARLAILDGTWYEKLYDEDYMRQLEKRALELYVHKGYDDKDIGITEQQIYANHEYTIIDDTDPNFMVVEDETGMVRTIPKNNDSYLWIVAAAIAGLLIL